MEYFVDQAAGSDLCPTPGKCCKYSARTRTRQKFGFTTTAKNQQEMKSRMILQYMY